MIKIIEFIKNHKKLFIGLGIVLIIIIGFICCSVKPKAIAFGIDYQDYNYVCGVSNTEQSGSDLLVDLEVIAYISNNNLIYDIDSFGSARLINGDAQEILVDKVYLIKYDSQGNIILRYILFDDFIAESNSSYYQQGYDSSVSDSSSQSYDNGYNAGYNQGVADNSISSQNVINAKDSEIAQKQATIDDLTDALADANRGFRFGSFTEMLGNIITFPIHFFKEGLNVDIWGVNVGAICVAIVLISATIGVIGIVLHGRSKQ